MDRSRKMTTARARAVVGLGLSAALGLALPGCARMRSNRPGPAPATLGAERVDGEYSSFHTARATSASATADPTRAQVAQADPPEPGGMVTEDANPPGSGSGRPEGPADLPVEIPTPAEPDPSTRLTSADRGVPDASRLLASSGLRGEPSAPSAPARAEDVGSMVAAARATLDRTTSYQASMHRQERVGSSLLPAEDLVLSVRREPRAVRLSWPEGPNQGREAIYRADAGEGKMHILVPNSPIPRIALALDNPMVRRNSRHPITEAGFDSIVLGLEQGLRSSGDSSVSYAGTETPAPLDRPHPCLVLNKPGGEVARVYLDPDNSLPAFIEVKAANGDLLEHYVFRDIRLDPPELASADAFDQDARWGPPRGLFGRVARGAGALESASNRQ